jgi:hypothetical protein
MTTLCVGVAACVLHQCLHAALLPADSKHLEHSCWQERQHSRCAKGPSKGAKFASPSVCAPLHLTSCPATAMCLRMADHSSPFTICSGHRAVTTPSQGRRPLCQHGKVLVPTRPGCHQDTSQGCMRSVTSRTQPTQRR